MNPNSLEEIGKKIEARLVEIRKSVGAPLGEFVIEHKEIDITGGYLKKLATSSPGEPIIISGEIYMAYIKDHTFHTMFDLQIESNQHENHCFVKGNKVHFYTCPTLEHMTAIGRKNRYRVTQKYTNTRKIDLRDASDEDARLAWCKNCIKILRRKGRVSAWVYRGSYQNQSERMAEYGDAKEIMGCVKALYDGDIRSAVQQTKDVFHRILGG